MAEQRKPSWRGKGKDETSVPRHRWQQEVVQDSKYESRKLWYRAKIAMLGVCFLGLLGVFIWYVLFLEPWPGLIAITVTKYDWPIPPNAQAKEDYDRLMELNRKTVQVQGLYDTWNPDDKRPDLPSDAIKRLQDQLQHYWRSKRSWFNRKRHVVTIYLSMHGAVNGKGEPCLLLAHAPALDTTAWLPLRDVLKTIQESLPKEVKKLLILDCTRTISNWKMGVLYNGFTESLDDAVKSADVPNLAVLNATGPGEVAWCSPEYLNGSFFGHAVQIGLEGQADGANGRSSDGVSLEELYDYVKNQVSHRVAENRADRQIPLLMKPDRMQDFRVARVAPGRMNRMLSKGKKAEGAPDGDQTGFTFNGSPRDLDQLWEDHMKLKSRPAYRIDPILWQEFEHKLLRLEELNLAGAAYKLQYQNLLPEVKQIASELDKYRLQDVPALSFPLAKNYQSESIEYLKRAAGIWQEFQSDTSGQTLQRGLDSIDDAGVMEESLKPGPIELHFMRMLKQHLDPSWKSAGSPLTSAARRAARVRRLSEEAAAPSDERAHYWIRSSVDSSDQRRRQAEDHLLVGSTEALTKAGNLWASAETDLVESIGDVEKVAMAFAVRDRACAELPYWAQWYTRRARPGVNTEDIASIGGVELLPLIHDARDLMKELNRPDSERRAATALADAAQAIQDRFEPMHAGFERACRGLLDLTVRDAAKLRDIADVLSVPLVTGNLRNDLRNEFMSLLRITAGAESTQQTTPAAPGRTHQDRLNAWSEHPAVLMLQGAEESGRTSSGAGRTFAEKGEWVRGRLATIPVEARTAKEAQNRESLFDADGLVRRAAVLRTDWSGFGTDPAKLLRSHDLHAMMVWHSQRALEDFWGPQTDGGSPYFVSAANRFLAAAQSFQPKKLTDLEVLRDQRAKAAKSSYPNFSKGPVASDSRDGFVLRPRSLAVLDDEDEDDVFHSIEIESHPALPQGTAAYYLHEPRTGANTEPIPMIARERGIPQNRLPLPLQESASSMHSLRYFLARRSLSSLDALRADVLFRGNVYPNDVPFQRDPGTLVTYIRPEYDDPRIQVLGPDERASIIFIFDCSYSMRLPAKVPARGTMPAREDTRMALAKEAFKNILQRLAKKESYRVGVIFYGHRVQWVGNAPNPNNVFADKVGKRIELRDVRAGADTELVLELGSFKDDGTENTAMARLNKHLDAATPWGHTPLYLAITEAARYLKADNSQNPRIIAITDGANDIFGADKDPQLKSSEIKYKDDVVAAIGKPQIPTLVIGFNIEADEQKKVEEDFKYINTEVGGHCQFLVSPDPDSLVARLEQSLDLRRYEVRLVPSDERIETQEVDAVAKLDRNRTYRAELVALDPKPKIPSPPMFLEGGEFIQMQLVNNVIMYNGCDDVSMSKQVIQDRQNSEDRYYVQCLRPEPDPPNKLVTFPICIEAVDTKKFTPRPAEYWVRIQPFVNDRAEGGMYTYYDRTFEPGTSVPILRLQAAGWPERANAAKIEFWCNMRRKTSPSKGRSFSLGQFATESKEVLQFPNLPKIEIEVEAKYATAQDYFQVIVTEIHTEPRRSLYALKVEIDTNSKPPPKKITHRYSEKCLMVKHTFSFENIRERSAVGDYRLIFLPHAASAEEAMYSGEMQVQIR